MESLNSSSTCEDVVKVCGVPEELKDSTVIVTGCNTGIGLEAAKQLALAGAGLVVMACRSLDKAETARASVLEDHPDVPMKCMPLDLSNLDSVKQFVAMFEELKCPPLRYLVLNAGLYPSAALQSSQGYELTFATNHLGHYYLTKLLLPQLRKNKPSRVVVLSSGSHYGPLSTKKVESKEEVMEKIVKARDSLSLKGCADAYGSSKLCNLLFAQELYEQEKDNGVTACSLHPGTLISTDIARGSVVGGWLLSLLGFLRITKTVNQGASTTLLCTLAPPDHLKGQYFDACQPKKGSKLATEKSRKLLWEISEELVNNYSSGGSSKL